jgi:hypothetical protein
MLASVAGLGNPASSAHSRMFGTASALPWPEHVGELGFMVIPIKLHALTGFHYLHALKTAR